MQVCELMGQLQGSGEYSMGMGVSRQLAEDFYADSVSDQSTLKTIREVYEQCGYLMDPHTAVAKSVHDRFVKSTRDDTPNVIVSTASPFKFVQDVLFAVTGKREGEPFQAARMLSQATGLEIPAQISSLETDQIRFSDESEKEQLSDRILEFLNR